MVTFGRMASKVGFSQSAFWLATKRPLARAEKLLRIVRGVVVVAGLAGAVGAAVFRTWLGLALAFFVTTLWYFAAALSAEHDLRQRSKLALAFEPVAPQWPRVGGIANRPQSLLFNVRNGDRCRVRAQLLSRSVRGISTLDYPEGDTVLRMHSPASIEQTINTNGTARVDVAYVWTQQRGLTFLRGDVDGAWGELVVTSADGLVTGQIALEDLDTGARSIVDFELSIGTAHPVRLTVTESSGG